MDFTREPLIETVITPKEGFKLIIRGIDRNSQEEYCVGAVEVVSFGSCYFFRSLEKPKAFLLPMTQYEIIESREVRVVLKNPQIDRSIKIGVGKKINDKKEKNEEEDIEEEGKKREKRSTRKRPPKEDIDLGGIKEGRYQLKSNLISPPKGLISDQIDRYKDYLVQQEETFLTEEEIEEKSRKIGDVESEKSFLPSSKKIAEKGKIFDPKEEEDVPVAAYIPLDS